MTAPHVLTIEGRRVVVQSTHSGLPQKLDALLSAMFAVTYRDDAIRPGGASVSCIRLRTHRLKLFRAGRWFAVSGLRKGEVLDLRLSMCVDCGTVQVRDVSFDLTLTDDRGRTQRAPIGGRGPARRDHVMDWYSGASARNRQHL